ncbi:SDR family oxidoreductase [Streptomyces sp. NPDC091387]|uniref:SDR family oxidoreductase n=1 Tax=Streptomyces sp. NPDC091387 TaxID=3365998 RepID=UPI00381D2864
MVLRRPQQPARLAELLRVLAEGGLVVAADVSEAGLRTTYGTAEADGTAGRLTTTVLDIPDEAAVRAGVAAAVATLGGLDVLVNAAGILRSEHTHKTSLEFFNKVIAVSLTGTFLMIREGFAGPDTVAGVVAMLGSQDGAFITGTEIRIDGGTHY